jgi:hypothetical protein
MAIEKLPSFWYGLAAAGSRRMRFLVRADYKEGKGVSDMRTKSRKKRTGTARDSQICPSPEPYICVQPDEAALVFDWLNRSGRDEDKEVAGLHLRICMHCQEAAAALLMLKRALKANSGNGLCCTGDTIVPQAAVMKDDQQILSGDLDHEGNLHFMKAGTRAK